MGRETVDVELRLVGTAIPALEFEATTGEAIGLADETRGDYVLFIYPRTGRPDQPESDDWALIPGAKGCTAESCEFRDLAAEFTRDGLSIYGLSTQDTGYQQEAAERLHLTYPLLSDPDTRLGGALGLATFVHDGRALYKRTTLVVRGGTIVSAFLEIDDAAAHPREVLAAVTAER